MREGLSAPRAWKHEIASFEFRKLFDNFDRAVGEGYAMLSTSLHPPAGMTQVFSFRSNSSQHAPKTSPERAAANIANSSAVAAMPSHWRKRPMNSDMSR